MQDFLLIIVATQSMLICVRMRWGATQWKISGVYKIEKIFGVRQQFLRTYWWLQCTLPALSFHFVPTSVGDIFHCSKSAWSTNHWRLHRDTAELPHISIFYEIWHSYQWVNVLLRPPNGRPGMSKEVEIPAMYIYSEWTSKKMFRQKITQHSRQMSCSNREIDRALRGNFTHLA